MQDIITRTINLNAHIQKVWNAISDHMEFGKWFLAVCDKPFTVGATIACQSLYPGHEHLSWEMQIVERLPPNQLSFLWPAYYGEDVERDANEDPWLQATFKLEEVISGTRLTLTESGFSQLHPDYAAHAIRMNEGGWDEQMKNIKRHVSA